MRYLILLLLITSCASRKVDVSKTETKTSVDSNLIVKKDSISEINKNVYITENSEELEIKPLVDSLPIIVNGKRYLNVVLRYKKQNKVLVDTTKEKVSLSSVKKLNVKREDNKTDFNKHIDKKANYFVYMWILLIPIGIYIYRQIKNKLFL